MRRNRWLLLVCALTLAVSAAAFVYWKQPARTLPYTPPATEPSGRGVVGVASLDTDPYDVLITYTDDGLSPADITIAQGTRVRFLNDSSEEFWPAVGIHPTHTLYPEKESTDCLGSSFDSCDALQKGEFFDFTLYYTGSWPYHDHLHAYNTGTITVTASSTR